MGAKERVRELGYTGVIASHKALSEWKGVEVDLWAHIEAPDLSPSDEEYPSKIWELIESLPSNVVGVLWESPYRSWEKEREYTHYDLIHRELQTVEAAVEGRRLLYYLSTDDPTIIERQSAWLDDLRIDAAAGTALAFSALAGKPTDEHQPYHPFLSDVADHPGATPLFPILNVGCVGQGECLWPTYIADTLSAVWPHMRGEGVGGFIALTPSLPLTGSTLDANLAVASAVVLSDEPVLPLLSGWFERHGLDHRTELPVAERLRSIQRSLQSLLHRSADQSILSAEPQRIRVQSVLAQLDELKLSADDEAKGIRSQISYFIRDAKRLLYQYMQANNISLPNVFAGDDMQDSFWTTMAGSSGKGISFGTSSSYLSDPQRGESGSAMEQIYLATYGIR